MSPRAVLRAAAPALLLACLVLLPFHDKAFTVDDTVFVSQARHALADPLHPTAFEMAWNDEPERVSRFLPTGPVIAWLLLPAAAAGGSEALAHAVQLLLLALAIFATVSLAMRLGLPRAWAGGAGLLLAATPTALAMAGTAMPDVPAMALGVAGVERLLAWRQGGRPGAGAAAAIFLALAALARTHLVLLLPVGALLLVEDPLSLRAWRGVPLRRWLPLAAAGLLVPAVLALTRDPQAGAGSIAGAAVALSSLDKVGPNAVAFCVHWVLALPFALPWAALRWRWLLRRPWAFLLASAGAALLPQPPLGPQFPVALAPVAGLGAAVLVDLVGDALRRRDAIQLSLGAWMLLPLAALPYTHFPAKYLLACAPAATILVARTMAASPGPSRRLLAATAVAGVALGVAILRADAAVAGLARDAARALVAPQVAAGRRVWYVGHWGFQWYAEQAGARFFPMRPPFPAPGDLVLSSLHCEPQIDVWKMTEDLAHLVRIEHSAPGGRVMDRASGAGFYSNFWGYLPWSWGSGVVEAIELWRVAPGAGSGAARAPAAARSRPAASQ